MAFHIPSGVLQQSGNRLERHILLSKRKDSSTSPAETGGSLPRLREVSEVLPFILNVSRCRGLDEGLMSRVQKERTKGEAFRHVKTGLESRGGELTAPVSSFGRGEGGGCVRGATRRTEHGRAGPGLRLLPRRHCKTGPDGPERAGTPDPPLVPT